MIGISVNPKIGIGDGIQFSSVPENYFHATGKKLYDVSRPWFFDHNPYVVRTLTEPLEKTIELWNFGPQKWEWPKVRAHGVYLSNAEIYAAVLGVKTTVLNRPRLYQFESVEFSRRETILLQTKGASHGKMPEAIIAHVVKKYGPTGQLFQIGPEKAGIGVPHIETKTLWDLAETISKARMLIGLDSGPAWVAAAYPDVVIKKLRTKPSVDVLRTWVPLAADNIHSHWDDRCHQIFNVSEYDVGFTSSYRRI